MQRVRVGVQLGSDLGNLLRLGRVVLGTLVAGHLRGLPQLLQHIPLLGLVGVQLQAEGTDADLVQPPLDHLQRGHFLGDEEHTAALSQGVCNEGSDGLGFACAGGAMEHEALALAGSFDGKELGGVSAQGQQHPILGNLPAQLHLLRVPGQPAVHEALYNFVPGQVLGAVADIVPHDELGEGEDAQIGALQHVPVLLAHNGLAQNGKHPSGVNAVLVRRQRIQPVDFHLEVLLELFQHGDVHLGVVVPQTDAIALGCALAHHLDRNQDQGRIAGLGASGILIPFEQAQGQIQGIGAVFLHGGPGAAIELLDGAAQLRLGKDGAETVILKFRLDQGSEASQLVHGFKVRTAQVPVRRAGKNVKVLPIGQGVLQLVQGACQDGDHGLAQAQIDQGIAQAQIQKLALPAQLFGGRGLRRTA